MKAICIKKCFAFGRIFEVGDSYVPNQGDQVPPHFKVTEEAPKVESPKPKPIYPTDVLEVAQEVQKVESEMKLSEIPAEEVPEVAPRKKKK